MPLKQGSPTMPAPPNTSVVSRHEPQAPSKLRAQNQQVQIACGQCPMACRLLCTGHDLLTCPHMGLTWGASKSVFVQHVHAEQQLDDRCHCLEDARSLALLPVATAVL